MSRKSNRRESDQAPESTGAVPAKGAAPGSPLAGLSGVPTPKGARSVSIVIPTTGSEIRLRQSLTSAVREIELRAIAADEILVIDDSGAAKASATVPAVLGAEDGDRRAKVRVVSTGEGQHHGFAAAVKRGMKEARNPLVLVIHDDVALHEGSVDALVKTFVQPGAISPQPESVFAVVPRVMRARAQEGSPAETTATITIVDDRLTVFDGPSAGVATGAPVEEADAPRIASFAPSSAFLVQSHEFAEYGGFDSLFAPFGWEDVDLSLAARRRGRLLLEVPAAKATHGLMEGFEATEGSDFSVPADVSNRIIERNRLLLRWKHLTTRAEATEHLVSLWRTILEAGLGGDRETLEDVCLAFEKLGDVTRSRGAVAGTASLAAAL